MGFCIDGFWPQRISKLSQERTPFLRRNFASESFFLGGAVGALAHGGELHSGAHVVEKEGDLLVAGAARNPAH